MGTTAQKLAKLAETKTNIRAAIIEKNVDVPSDATFASYSYYIGQISTGVIPTGNIELQKQSGTDVTNYATASVKSGSVNTPATTKQQSTPSITVSSSGLITASVAASSISVTPNVGTAGWISSGTAGTISLSASNNTYQLSTQAAATITPSSSSQIAVASGKYTTGAVTVAAVPTETGSATDNGTFTPTSGKFYSQFTVNVDYNIYRTGSGAPSASLGNDGDIYFDIS